MGDVIGVIAVIVVLLLVLLLVWLLVSLYLEYVQVFFTTVAPTFFYCAALLCSLAVPIVYAHALFKSFGISTTWYRKLVLVLVFVLVALTYVDLLYLGSMLGMAVLPAAFAERLLEITRLVVSGLVGNRQIVALAQMTLQYGGGVVDSIEATGADAYRVCFSFLVKSALIVPLLIAARGLASTTIEDAAQPAFRSYFYGPAWKDLVATVSDIRRDLRTLFGGVCKFAGRFYRGTGWTGILLTWPLAIVGGLALLPTVAIGGLQLLLLVLTHSVFLGVVALLARGCAYVIFLVERAVILSRAGYAKCPHAECHAPVPLPVFRCPACRAEHDNLVPGRCGVLMRTCKCGKERLPTLFWLGKGRLPSQCRECRKPMREELFAANVHIPIYGGPSAGKTMYMVAVTWELLSNQKSVPDVEAHLIDKTKQYERDWQPQFEKGLVQGKTVNLFPDAFLLSMQRGGGGPASVYLYDPAGEALQSEEHLRGHGFLEYSDGLAILIDPLSLQSFKERYQELGQAVPATTSQDDPAETVTRICIKLRELEWNKPVALVLTKADLPGFEEVFGVRMDGSVVGKSWKKTGADQSAKLAEWFEREEGHLLSLLRENFSDLRFFAVSALGRGLGAPADVRGFTPQRVLEPIAWLLSRRATFAHPVRERFFGRMLELGAAVVVVAPLILLPTFVFALWGVPYVSGVLERSRPVRILEVEVAPAVGGTPRDENALNLDGAARRLIQTGLSTRGFDAGPADGVFGSRSRGAIAAWQVAQGASPTGYLNAAAVEALVGETADPAPTPPSEPARELSAEAMPRAVPRPEPPRRTAAPDPPRTSPVADPARRRPVPPPRRRPAPDPPRTSPVADPARRRPVPPPRRRPAPDPPRTTPAPVDRMTERAATLLAAARRGDVQAQVELAMLYAQGQGVDQSYPQAFFWLEEAARRNQAEAAMHLALMYAAGEGVSADLDQALPWFRRFLLLSGTDASSLSGDGARQLDDLVAVTVERYADLTQDYLRRWTALTMERDIVVFGYGRANPDAAFRRRGGELRSASRQAARSIRRRARNFDWTLSSEVRSVLDRGALAQRQRSLSNVRRNAADYLVEQIRRVLSGEAATATDGRYRSTLQVIDTWARRFEDLVENKSQYVGAIKIDAEPRDATVFIDGERYGTVDDIDDYEGRIFLAGERTIRVSRDGYRTHEETIDLGVRERYLMRGSLERVRGR